MRRRGDTARQPFGMGSPRRLCACGPKRRRNKCTTAEAVERVNRPRPPFVTSGGGYGGEGGPVVQVRLLGPVDVVVHGHPKQVHGLRRKAVLAVLALHGREIVSTGRLVEAVWGEAVPPTALNTLQSHVSYLRKVLGSKAAIVARPPGYVLDVGDEPTDVDLVERLLRRGRQSADPGQGARCLRAALALWRGQPMADLAGLVWLEQQAERLDASGPLSGGHRP